MKGGIIGAGRVGTGLGKRLVPKGHNLMLSYSWDTAKMTAAAKDLDAKTGSVAEAVTWRSHYS